MPTIVLCAMQGHLFRAAFLKQVPLFMRNLTENIALCLVASGLEATSRYCLAIVEQQWQRCLTERIHEDYFKNMVRLSSTLHREAHALAIDLQIES